MFKKLYDRAARRAASIVSRGVIPIDFDDATRETVRAVGPFTATSPERVAASCDAARYVVRAAVPGAIVECGVWRGGMIMAMIRALRESGDVARDVYLYDTFSGMSTPTEDDRSFDGTRASTLLARSERTAAESVWCYASLEDVRINVLSTGYDEAKLHFIEGKVEDTIPKTMPAEIAILRLDTDWYASTKHELQHLFPRLSRGGILIIDDYGHWSGARKAVDDYVRENDVAIFLARTDYTGRIAVKR